MRIGSSKTLFTRGKGQSLVEFALVLPVMVLIVAGIFDLGRAFFASITITNAAREGARYGTLNHGDTAGDFQKICNTTMNEAKSSRIILNPTTSTITISCGTSSQVCQAAGTPDTVCPARQPITVRIQYNYNQMLLQFFMPSGIMMDRQVEMMVP